MREGELSKLREEKFVAVSEISAQGIEHLI